MNTLLNLFEKTPKLFYQIFILSFAIFLGSFFFDFKELPNSLFFSAFDLLQIINWQNIIGLVTGILFFFYLLSFIGWQIDRSREHPKMNTNHLAVFEIILSIQSLASSFLLLSPILTNLPPQKFFHIALGYPYQNIGVYILIGVTLLTIIQFLCALLAVSFD